MKYSLPYNNYCSWKGPKWFKQHHCMLKEDSNKEELSGIQLRCKTYKKKNSIKVKPFTEHYWKIGTEKWTETIYLNGITITISNIIWNYLQFNKETKWNKEIGFLSNKEFQRIFHVILFSFYIVSIRNWQKKRMQINL